MDDIGESIRTFREKAGVSQRKLGISLGLSDKAISAYESGRTVPSIETLIRIAEILNITLDDLWESSTKNSTLTKLDQIEKDLNRLLKEVEEIRNKIDID